MFALTIIIIILGLNFKQKEAYMSEKTSWLLEVTNNDYLKG